MITSILAAHVRRHQPPEWGGVRLRICTTFAFVILADCYRRYYPCAMSNPPSPEWWHLAFWTSNAGDIRNLVWSLVALVGLPFLIWRTWATDRQARAAFRQAVSAAEQAKAASCQADTATKRHEEQTKADQERRITESFATAIEQLGSDKLEIRLGSIYTLERIARESKREYWPIMETLTAFVRERAPAPKDRAESVEADPDRRPPADIQAILTVLGRREEKRRKSDTTNGRALDLRGTDLRGAHLPSAYLEGVRLFGARLDDAKLFKAHFENADLCKASLMHASLREAHLEGACLEDSYLQKARFEEAHLHGAMLGGALLRGTNFFHAHLEGADLNDTHDLKQQRLDDAYGDEHTMLPQGLTRPVHWQTPPARTEIDR